MVNIFKRFYHSKTTFFIVLCLLILLAWSPYIFAFGGRIISWDGNGQLLQILKLNYPNDFSPWIATMVMSCFVNFSKMFTSDINNQVLFFTLFQLILYILVIARILQWIKENTNKLCFVVCSLFYLFFPLFPFYAMGFDKTGLFVLGTLIISYVGIHFYVQKKVTLFDIANLCVGFSLMIVFRDDGFYIALFAILFVLIFSKCRKKFILPLIVILGLHFTIAKVVYPSANLFTTGGGGASLSLPTQQVARTYKYKGKISYEQNKKMSSFLPVDSLADSYSENYADPVKFSFRRESNQGNFKNIEEQIRHQQMYFKQYKTIDFIKLWITIGLKNPGIYWEAFVNETNAYYIPHAQVNRAAYYGQLYFGMYPIRLQNIWIENNKQVLPGLTPFGNVNRKHALKFRENFFDLSKLSIFNDYLYSAWLYTWILLASIIFMVGKQLRARTFAPMQFFNSFFALLILGIALLSPVNGAIRYILPIIISTPLIILVSIPFKKRSSGDIR